MSRLWRMDSSSSDDSIEDEPLVASEDDRKFMEEALKVAKSSPDPHKQVCGIHSTLREYRNTNQLVVVLRYRLEQLWWISKQRRYLDMGGIKCPKDVKRDSHGNEVVLL